MKKPVVDRRFVLDDFEGYELRLAFDVDTGTFHVVGTRSGRLAYLDELSVFKLTLIGANETLTRVLGTVGNLSPATLDGIGDEEYARLVCPDPNQIGRVQRSSALGAFEVVEATDL